MIKESSDQPTTIHLIAPPTLASEMLIGQQSSTRRESHSNYKVKAKKLQNHCIAIVKSYYKLEASSLSPTATVQWSENKQNKEDWLQFMKDYVEGYQNVSC